MSNKQQVKNQYKQISTSNIYKQQQITISISVYQTAVYAHHKASKLLQLYTTGSAGRAESMDALLKWSWPEVRPRRTHCSSNERRGRARVLACRLERGLRASGRSELAGGERVRWWQPVVAEGVEAAGRWR
jgi:hypothetical protein